MGNKHKLIAYWEENFNAFDELQSNNIEGVLSIEAPFAEITLSDGFWANINKKFSKMIDFAEEEDFEAEIISDLILEIKDFANKNYNKNGIYEVITGEQIEPEKKLLKAKIKYEELRAMLDSFCDFLSNAKEKNKNIIIML